MGLDVRSLREELEMALPDFLTDLATLVNIDSPSDDKSGNDRVLSILASKYASLGGHCTLINQTLCGDFLRAEFHGAGSRSLLLLGHTDTVYPPGTVPSRPFRLEGERAFGPGVADMKAGDLAIVYALRTLLHGGWDGFGTIVVLHNSDEEIGSPFSHELVKEEAREASATLVLEAARANGDIVSARKGIASYDMQVRGRAAHAGVDHAHGRSAALAMARLVNALESITDEVLGVTVNVGSIDVPGKRNVVPSWGQATCELRAPTEETLQSAMERMRSAAGQVWVEGTEIDFQEHVAHHPMARTPGTEHLLTIARGVATALEIELRDTATGGASDGNTAAAAGCPVLDGLGPIGGAAHSPGEYLEVSSIVPRVALLAGLMAAICDGASNSAP